MVKIIINLKINYPDLYILRSIMWILYSDFEHKLCIKVIGRSSSASKTTLKLHQKTFYRSIASMMGGCTYLTYKLNVLQKVQFILSEMSYCQYEPFEWFYIITMEIAHKWYLEQKGGRSCTWLMGKTFILILLNHEMGKSNGGKLFYCFRICMILFVFDPILYLTFIES